VHRVGARAEVEGEVAAIETASRDPDTYAGLILAASAPLGGLVTPEENYPVLELLPSNASLLELSLGALFPSGRPANFSQLLGDAVRMAPDLYSGNARALAAWSVAPEALAGLPDLLITPEMVRAQGEALGVPVRLLAEFGHSFPQEAPGAFLDELREFLSGL